MVMICCFYSMHAWTSPTYPKPKPHKIGPNKSIQVTFQHLLLERAIVPVRQIKQRID